MNRKLSRLSLKASIIALAISSVIGCGEQMVLKEDDLPKVRIVEVGDSSIQHDGRVYFPAVAQAADRAHLSFRVAGKVSQLYVSDGSVVKAGEVLAELDPNDYQLKVDEAQASFSVADSRYKRSEQLVKQGMLAQSQFDELKAQRAIEKSELDLAKLRLSFTKLRAPIDGVISRVNVDQFENVQVGQQLINIHDVNNVDIIVRVPDQVFANRSGQEDYSRMQGTVRAQNGKEYTAYLKEFTTEQDPEAASYSVTLSMPMPKDQFILDGMAVEVARVNSQFTRAGVITVPIEAIFNPDGESLDATNKFVWVLGDDQTVTKTRVITSKINDGSIQVVNGLQEGQKIVIAGISKLKDGMRVEPVTQEITQ